MESENTESGQVPINLNMDFNKPGVITTHALGLQDLYKAAFSQETVNNFIDISNKAVSFTTLTGNSNLLPETVGNYYGGNVQIEADPKSGVVVRNPDVNEGYQVYTLKDLQYSVDFVEPQENALDVNHVNYEEANVENLEGDEVLSSASVVTHSYESLQNDSSSVLDLDNGARIRFNTSDGTPSSVPTAAATTSSSPVTYNYESCEYTGDAQILHRYLCDSVSLQSYSEITSTSSVEMVTVKTVNFVHKENENDYEKNLNDSDSVGVNPDTLGVRFEDCDFNSSDSFASTESIIPKNIKCPKCPKKFMFKSDLLRHDKYKHSVKPKLLCKYCHKTFLSHQNLLFHEKSHKRYTHKCETCEKVFKKSDLLVKHMMKMHSTPDSYLCSYCGGTFTSEILLDTHIKKDHVPDSEKPFKCKFCSKGFDTKKGLCGHVKTHREQLAFGCQQCDKRFSKVRYLRNHQRSHQNEGPFICKTCGKNLRDPKALAVHNLKHVVKRFSCNVCTKSFSYKPCFKLHMEKHAKETSQTCDNCQKTFATSEDLNKHECVRSEQDISQQSEQDFSQQSEQDFNQQSEQDFSQQSEQDFNQQSEQDFSQQSEQDFNQQSEQDFSQQSEQDFSQQSEQDFNQQSEQDFSQQSEQDFSQQSEQNFSQPIQQNFSQPVQQDFSQPIQQDFSQPIQQDFNQPNTFICHPINQIIQANIPQPVFAQTIGFEEAVTTVPNVAFQNVNVIVDPSFAIQQPIILTSFGSVEMGVIQ